MNWIRKRSARSELWAVYPLNPKQQRRSRHPMIPRICVTKALLRPDSTNRRATHLLQFTRQNRIVIGRRQADSLTVRPTKWRRPIFSSAWLLMHRWSWRDAVITGARSTVFMARERSLRSVLFNPACAFRQADASISELWAHSV